MKQERYFYPAVFNYDDEEIAVTFPDLNVATSGVKLKKGETVNLINAYI